jgi:endonuclease/exonuclease/phosphatase (EEP) superfamily protein YafD
MDPMRLVTANLFNDRARPKAVEELIEDVRPDVFCAQELGRSAATVLHGGFPSGLINPRDDCNGHALVARSEIRVELLDLPARPGLVTVVSSNGVETVIISIHLSNPVDGRKALDERRRQVDGVLARIDGIERVVVVGDLNATTWWTSYRRLRSVLADGVLECWRRSSARTVPTWGPFPGGPALMRIDHVLTRGVRVDAVSVRRVAGSDHRALVVDLEPA